MSSKIIASTTSGTALNMSADTSGVLEIQTGSTPTTAITVDASQKVGIGTTNPLQLLHLSSNSSPLIQVTYSGVGASQIGVVSGGALTFGVDASNGSTERMRIDSSGNLLLNTTSTTGTACMHIPATASKYSISFKGSATTSSACAFYNSGGGGVGEILIGASSTTYATSSDYRLKEKIAPMTGALATVSALKPVTYDWKIGGSSQGFIAHELAEVFPEAVVGTKDAVETIDDVDAEGKVIGTKEVPKYQGIDTSFLVATLTAAIQELNAKVDAQAAEIATLKGVA